jgi:pyruvate dehydrogenase E1 component
LGTDGYGRSDTRAALRRFFEVDRHHIAVAALKALADDGSIEQSRVEEAIPRAATRSRYAPAVRSTRRCSASSRATWMR